MSPTVAYWLGWLPGALVGWAPRGLWINRKVKRMLDTAKTDADIGNFDAAKRNIARASAILDVL